MIVKGDGSLMKAEVALEYPVETILSGPAASVVGAGFLTGLEDFVVSDMGGTTTDIAVVAGGRPVIRAEGALVGAWRTMVEAVDVRTSGLGGDSEVHFDRQHRLRVGPRKAMPLSLLAQRFPATLAQLRSIAELERLPDHAAQFAFRNPGREPPEHLSALERRVWDALDLEPEHVSTVVRNASGLEALRRLADAGLATLRPSRRAMPCTCSSGSRDGGARRPSAVRAFSPSRSATRARHPRPLPRARSANAPMNTWCARRARAARRGARRTTRDSRRGAATGACSAIGSSRRSWPASRSRLCCRRRSASRGRSIAIGAPVGAYYPEVARRLGAQLSIPEHAAVCNAVGAVAGVVSQTVEILVNQPTFKVFRVHDPAGSEDYPDPEARARARAARVARARARGGAARRRGRSARRHQRERKARARRSGSASTWPRRWRVRPRPAARSPATSAPTAQHRIKAYRRIGLRHTKSPRGAGTGHGRYPYNGCMKQPDETLGRRSRRRPGTAEVSHAVFDRTRPYRHLRNPFEPLKVFSDDQVAAIHEAALVILETQGMKVLSADARVRYAQGRRDGRRGDADRAPRPRTRRRIARHRAARHHAAHRRPRAQRAAVEGLRRLRADLRTAEHHGHGARPARRNVRGLLQSDEAVPKLRGDPRARRRDRAAGYSGAHPSSGSDARAAHAVRQDSVHLLARPRPGRRQLRADPPRARHLARGVPLAPLHLHHHQHQLAAAARHSDGGRHHRFRRRRSGAHHHAVHAGRGDGAGDDRGRADARARRGARGPDARADRAAGRADRVRQLHLERRHEIRIAGLRHAGVRQGGVRRRPDGAISRTCRGAHRTPPPRTSPTSSRSTNRR